jgi:Tol biopolymer transport system component
VDGGAPSRVTNFKGGDTIAVHAWSPDGKLLAMVRVATTRDVVVIRDVRR